jgi:hypothetical protein
MIVLVCATGAAAQTAQTGGTCTVVSASTQCTVTLNLSANTPGTVPWNGVVLIEGAPATPITISDTDNDTFVSTGIIDSCNTGTVCMWIYLVNFSHANASEVVTLGTATSGDANMIVEVYSGGFATLDQIA